MGWLSSLFNRKPDQLAPPGMRPIEITFTDEEQAAILEQHREISSDADLKPGHVLYAIPEMEQALRALGLVKHVHRQLAIAHKVPAAEFPSLLDKIIKTQVKACVVHGFPYYVYIWAVLNEEKGDAATAKKLYARFLSQQAEFEPTRVDELIVQLIKPEAWYDPEGAIAAAREVIEG
jgi:hypothetical protein